MFVALQLTVVVPSAKVEPEAGLQTTGAFSSAVATYVTTAPALLVASAVMSAGSVSVGGPVTTVTVNVPTATFAKLSVAVHSTVVVPAAKVEPEAGEEKMVGDESRAAVAVTVNVTTGLVFVMSAGRLSTGAFRSLTKTGNEPLVVPKLF